MRKEALMLAHFRPGSALSSLTLRWFTTEQAGAACPSPCEADTLCHYPQIVFFHVLHCWLLPVLTLHQSLLLDAVQVNPFYTNLKKKKVSGIPCGLGQVQRTMSWTNTHTKREIWKLHFQVHHQ